MSHRNDSVLTISLFAVLALAGCGGGGDGGGDDARSWTVTATAGVGGEITPGQVVVAHGATASFQVVAGASYGIANVSGCGGTLVGGTYTTGPVTADCAVQAAFAAARTIGGTVTGLAWGGHVVLHNNGGDPVSVNQNGPFSFSRPVGQGGSYAVTVATQPYVQHCTVSQGTGTTGAADVTTVQVVCKDAVRSVYPKAGASWNDYVKNDGATVLTASDTACTGAETGGHSACLHGGERRQLGVSGAQSCLGLSATDELDAFDWRCDESSGIVRFVTGSLKPGRRLADLVDFGTSTWRENVVTVRNGDGVVATSARTRWWSNPVVTRDEGITFEEAIPGGTILLVSGSARARYELGVDRTALVVEPGATLTGPGTDGSVISVRDGRFLWLEGNVNASADMYGVSGDNLGFSVLRGLRVANAIQRGIHLDASPRNLLAEVMVVNAGDGIYLGHRSDGNVIAGVTVVNSGSGVVIDQSHDNLVRELTTANQVAMGLYHNEAANSVSLSVMAARHGAEGLLGVSAHRNLYADVATAHNYTGVALQNCNDNRFSGLLEVGHNSDSNCLAGGGANPALASHTCASQGASDAVTSIVSLATSFAGAVTTADAANASDTNGAAAFPADATLFDWLDFDNALRAWGTASGTFPSNEPGPWIAGDGRIWDWSLAAADAVARGVLTAPTGDDTFSHTWSNATATTFLRHAAELDGDRDGLCESNETCLYTPNIGAYQGHGDLVSAGTFTDGAVTGVRLLEYASNGR